MIYDDLYLHDEEEQRSCYAAIIPRPTNEKPWVKSYDGGRIKKIMISPMPSTTGSLLPTVTFILFQLLIYCGCVDDCEYSYDTYCYYWSGYDSIMVTYSEAATACKELQTENGNTAALASIESYAENSYIYETIIYPSQKSSSTWIGYNDIANEGYFVWEDGSNSSYENWDAFEPNNFVNDELYCSGQDCTRIRGASGYWDDYYCEYWPWFYLCKWDSMTTNLTVGYCEYGYYHGTNCYYWSGFDSKVKTYSGAAVACNELSTGNGNTAALASIESDGENSYIYDTFISTIQYDTWIGYNDLDSEGEFVWEDGSNSNYTHWDASEPNNEYCGQDCVRMYSDKGGLWDDDYCDAYDFYYICKWHSSMITSPPNITNGAGVVTEKDSISTALTAGLAVVGVMAILLCCCVGMFWRQRIHEKRGEIETERSQKHELWPATAASGEGAIQTAATFPMEEKSSLEERKRPSRSHQRNGTYIAFISHCKNDSGYPAVLFKEVLEKHLSSKNNKIENIVLRTVKKQKADDVFLDTDDLHDLNKLLHSVQHSRNFIVLLSENYFSRPWCLLELWTAVYEHKKILPILLEGAGCPQFNFGDAQAYWNDLCSAPGIDQSCLDLLNHHGASVQAVEGAVRRALEIIASPYSSSATRAVRIAQINDICRKFI